MISAAATFRAPSRPAAARLPVTLVTGFLGSGKTTLINHILSNRQGVRAAVLVNEFGDIGIDNDLIIASADDMIELNNGCICCTTNNDLIDSIVRVLARADQLDHIIVETTGVADPLPVALTFLRSEFRGALRLDAIVTVADAENFSLDRFDRIAARHQLRHADAVLLNKCDTVTAPRIADIEARIRAENPNARIIHTTRAAVPLPLILDVDLFREHPATTTPTCTKTASPPFPSPVTGPSPSPASSTSSTPAVRRMFRGKGFLWLAETDKRYVFHLVGNRFSLDEDTRTDPGANRLVLIGRDLDEPDLRTRLASCLAAAPEPTAASQLAMAGGLAALAGATDVHGLTLLRDLFVSFMSGNSTMLGVAIGRGDFERAGRIAGIVGLFVAGATAGSLIAALAGPRHTFVVLFIVTVLLGPDDARAPMEHSIPGGGDGPAQRRDASCRRNRHKPDLRYRRSGEVRQGLGLLLCRRQEDASWWKQGVLWACLLTGAAAAAVLELRVGAGIGWALPVLAAALTIAAALQGQRLELNFPAIRTAGVTLPAENRRS